MFVCVCVYVYVCVCGGVYDKLSLRLCCQISTDIESAFIFLSQTFQNDASKYLKEYIKGALYNVHKKILCN